MDSADDLDLTLLDQIADHVAAAQEFIDLHADVGLDDLVDELGVGRAAVGADRGLHGVDGRFDLVEQGGQVADFHAVAGAHNRSTGGVAHDHDQLGTGRGGGELEAAEEVGVDDVTGDATDKDIAHALVEDDLRGRARVQAGQHHGEGELTTRGIALLVDQVAVDGLTGDEARVSFLQNLQRRVRRQRLLSFLVKGAVVVVCEGDR